MTSGWKLSRLSRFLKQMAVTGVFAPIVGGLIIGAKVPLFSPIVYVLSRFRRDLFLIGFAVYCIALGCEIGVSSVYEVDYTVVFAVILPTMLLLDCGLRVWEFDRVELVLICLILLGLFLEDVFVIAVVTAFVYNFWRDKPKWGGVIAVLSVVILICGLTALKVVLGLIGSSSSQVAFIGAVLAITVVIWLRVLNRFNYS